MADREQELPPVDVSTLDTADPTVANEEKTFAREGTRLDRQLRTAAAVVGLAAAVVLFFCGLVLAFRFSRPIPVAQGALSWHIVAATLVALFSVPTILVLAVLRSSSAKQKDESDSVHAVIGTKVMSLIDKLIDKAVKD